MYAYPLTYNLDNDGACGDVKSRSTSGLRRAASVAIYVTLTGGVIDLLAGDLIVCSGSIRAPRVETSFLYVVHTVSDSHDMLASTCFLTTMGCLNLPNGASPAACVLKRIILCHVTTFAVSR